MNEGIGTMLAIRNATVFTPDRPIERGVVYIEDGRIVSVDRELTNSTNATLVDADGLFLIPGLLDLQCNGIRGFDVLSCGQDIVQAIADVLPEYGCTGVLPTIVSAPRHVLREGLAAIAIAADIQRTGATILGAHLEGPWLSPQYHGAHHLEHIRPFSLEEWAELSTANPGAIRIVTLAPEVEGNADAVATIRASGSIVSLGHSGASYDDALVAARNGAGMATHLFNAMSPLHHRQVTLPNAALDLPQLVPSIIPDGFHVHPSILRLAVRARGHRGLAIVTDSVPSAGQPHGSYNWNGTTVHWDGATVHFADGGLAGSGITPIQALARYVTYTGLSLAEALPAMTSTPAELLGLGQERGSIIPGARADLVLLTKDFSVQTTYVAGEVAYSA
ncbi:MAG: N-acetylglucosamine-6-phosphate deacetylase [Chloroflexi bacterium]|nr:N-acetylglucosamine-6-phosphate deacetylase [Chloroflexota bacterium]